MANTVGTLTMTLTLKKRWWFGIVWPLIVLGIRARIIRDMDAVTSWMARHAFIVRVTDREGRVKSL